MKKKLMKSLSVLLTLAMLGGSFGLAGVSTEARADESFYGNASGERLPAVGNDEKLPVEGETAPPLESESESFEEDSGEKETPIEGEDETPEESESGDFEEGGEEPAPRESESEEEESEAPEENEPEESETPDEGAMPEIPDKSGTEEELPDEDILFRIESETDGPGIAIAESVVTVEKILLEETENLGGYVASVIITGIEDGTEPFDTVDVATPSEYRAPGIDTVSNNRIVRTFDSVSYDVTATFGARHEEETAESAVVYFEMILPAAVTEAAIDMDLMNWFKSANPGWQIDFLDSNDQVVMIEKSNGYYYMEAEDYVSGDDDDEYAGFTTRTYIDALATGSSAAENETAYQVEDIVKQRLRGTYTLKAEEGTDNVLSSTKGWTAGVFVYNAACGREIAPSFRVWFDGNEENLGPVTEGEDEDESDSKDSEYINTVTAETVYVTAAPKFDMQLTYDTYLMYNAWYDFASGDEVEDETLLSYLEAMSALPENYGVADPSRFTDSENKVAMTLDETQKAKLSDIRYGQMNTLSIALYLANEYLSKKEMKGISLPVGDIAFDIELKAEAGEGAGTNTDSIDTSDIDAPNYYAVLWDYNENVSGTSLYTYEDDEVGDEGIHSHQRQGMESAYKGNLGRNLSWDGISESRTGYNVPYAYNGGVSGGRVSAAYAYDGGYLTLTGIGGNTDAENYTEDFGDTGDIISEDESNAPTLTTSPGDANTVYSFSLTDYDVELDNWSFPTQTRGGSGRALGTTQFCIFGGMVQVLNVFPRVQKTTATIDYTYTIGNLSLTDFSGQSIGPDMNTDTDDDTGAIDYSYEVRGYGSSGEGSPFNEETGTLTLYPPGTSAKGNWFGGKADSIESLDSLSRFSGIEWDAATLLGSDIYIIGRFEVGNSSSSRVGAMNYLQLFDSRGLYTRPNASSESVSESGGGKEDTGDEEGDDDSPFITSSDIEIYSQYANLDDSAKESQSMKLLFAADPDFPYGYDTNSGSADAENNERTGAEIETYMNTVREEDLVYSDRLYMDEHGHYTMLKFDTDGDGTEENLTCIGYLIELRNTNFKSNAYFTFPMTVTDDDELKTETVMTVNAVRAWAADSQDSKTMESLSWENGSWGYDETAAAYKNSLSGYPSITKRSSSGSGDIVTGNGWENHNGTGEKGYKKVVYGIEGYEEGDDGGYQYGNTLLILAYEASLSIDADQSYYDMDSDAGTVCYTVSKIQTKLSNEKSHTELTTDLSIYIDLDPYSSSGSAYPTEGNSISDYVSIMSGSFAVVVDGESILISSDPEKPTSVTFTSGDETRTYAIYVSIDPDASGATLYLKGVYVGDTLPDITFSASLGAEMENNDYVWAGADISGDGFVHAFSSATDMMDDTVIYTTRTSGTRLKKKVDLLQIEQGGTITYTLSYTNQSSNAVTMYLYDIIPYNGDPRRTDYHGMTKLTGFSAASKQGNPSVTAYYSDDDQDTLTQYIGKFGGNGAEGNESVIRGWLPSGDEITKVTTDSEGNKLFSFTKFDTSALSKDSGIPVTCIYVAIDGLPSGDTITLSFSMGTGLNRAYDIYGNYAYCWTTSSGAPLKSNLVQTVVTGSESDISTGNISVTKHSYGSEASADDEFSFSVVLGTKLSGTYGDVAFSDGTGEFHIKSGDTVLIEGLPEGTTYTVTETDAKDYTATDDGKAGGSVAGNSTDEIILDNIKGSCGSLTVTKKTYGDEASADDEFSFSVAFSEPLSGTYGDLVFTNGTSSFNLKSGESVSVKGIPAGTTYTVTETDTKGYLAADGGIVTGTVTEEGSIVTIDNIKGSTGSVTISAEAFGEGAKEDDEFTFTVTLDIPLNGTYGGVTFADGVGEVTLLPGESVTIEGIPEGTGYTVEETAPSGYEANGGTTRTGTVTGGGEEKAHFDNIIGATGSLSVTTTAGGNRAKEDDEFTFTVTLDIPLNGTYGDVTFTDGVAKFKLKSGESVTIEGLPEGTSFTVTEIDSLGYTTSDGTQSGSVTDGDTDITIKNTKRSSSGSGGGGGGGGGGTAFSGGGSSQGPGTAASASEVSPSDSVPKTGDETHLHLYMLLALMGLVGSALCLRRLRNDN